MNSLSSLSANNDDNMNNINNGIKYIDGKSIDISNKGLTLQDIIKLKEFFKELYSGIIIIIIILLIN
jgi:hypothetical protein